MLTRPEPGRSRRATRCLVTWSLSERHCDLAAPVESQYNRPATDPATATAVTVGVIPAGLVDGARRGADPVSLGY